MTLKQKDSDIIAEKDAKVVVVYSDASEKIAADKAAEEKAKAEKEAKEAAKAAAEAAEAAKTDPASYGLVDYDAWNHDEVAYDTKVQISGKVLQVSKGWLSVTLRVASDGRYDDVVLVTVDKTYFDSNILASDDMVTIYGLIVNCSG